MGRRRHIAILATAIGMLSFALVGCGTQSNVSIGTNTTTTKSNGSGNASVDNTTNSSANNTVADNVPRSTANGQKPEPILTHLAMINTSVGYADGPKGIYQTIDGGSSWKNITPPNLHTGSNGQINVFPQTMYVWASQSSFNQKQIKLFSRRYTGQTWHTITVQNRGYVQGLHVTGNFGYFWIDQGAAAGSSAIAIYETTNGGQTWTMIAQTTNQNIPHQIPFGGDKSGVTFINPQHGWVSGFTPVNGHIYLYQTTNGGQTWSPENVPVPKTYANAQIGANPPVFFNATTGVFYAVADTSSGSTLLIYKTNDGGARWKLANTIQDKFKNSNFQFVKFLSTTNWIVSDGNLLYKTSNGGVSWKTIHLNINSENISQMQFISVNVGWLRTNNGTIFETENGGETWQQKS